MHCSHEPRDAVSHGGFKFPVKHVSLEYIGECGLVCLYDFLCVCIYTSTFFLIFICLTVLSIRLPSCLLCRYIYKSNICLPSYLSLASMYLS